MAENIDLNRLQLALPRVGSLLFAGAGLYVGFIDPKVRGSHCEQKQQLNHWSAMYNHSKVPMGSCALITSLLGANAYRLTHEPLWLYGSLAAFAIIPFTYIAIMGINNKLHEDTEGAKKGKKISGLADKLCQWVYRHRVRAFLALVAAGLFYAAQGKPKLVLVPVAPAP